jgi:hypothetical protein
MNDKVLFSGILEGVSLRADKSLSLRLSTQEVSDTEKLKFMGLHQQFIQILFKSTDISKNDVKELDQTEINVYESQAKTPSKRLRGVMYRFWEHEGKPGEFPDFYGTEMEKIITHYKNKLD